MARILILLAHFIGLGLLIAVQVGSFILDSQYRKAPDLQTKAILLRALRPIGLLSPVAMVIMLSSGIGNMTQLGFGLFSMGWLTAKIIFFSLAAVSGVLVGITARKRGALVMSMLKGEAPKDANEVLKSYDKQLRLSHVVFPVLLIIILSLSIYGRLGGQ